MEYVPKYMEQWRLRRSIRRHGGRIGKSVTFENSGNIRPGPGWLIDPRVTLVGSRDPRDGGLHLGAGITVREGCYISARFGNVTIGPDSYLGHRVWVGGRGTIEIGEWFLCGPGTVIISSNHDVRSGVPYRLQDEKPGKISIGENVWVGANVVVLPDSHIGAHAIIGAGSVVSGYIAPHAKVAGVPARRIDRSDGQG
jgi:acetyltransferase-like isoleucine patch superfamily enzyme